MIEVLMKTEFKMNKQNLRVSSARNPMKHYFQRRKKLSEKRFQKSLCAHTRQIFKLGLNLSFPENTNRFVHISEGGDCIGK